MSPRGMEQLSENDELNQALNDYDIKSPDDWREVFIDDTKDSDIPDEPGYGTTDKKDSRPLELNKKYEKGQIDVEVWQRELDDAFRRGFYQVVASLRIARPDLQVDKSLVNEKYAEILNTRSNNWNSEVSSILYASKTNPDSELVNTVITELITKREKWSTKEQFDFGELARLSSNAFTSEKIGAALESYIHNENWRFDHNRIKAIVARYNYVPGETIISEIANKTDSNEIRDIAEELHIPFTGKLLENYYKTSFQSSGFDVNIFAQPRVLWPSEEFIQKQYRNMLFFGSISKINDLKKASGYEPNFSDKEIHEKFELVLSQPGVERYSRLKRFSEELSTPVPQQMIVDKAIDILEHLSFQDLKALEEVFGKVDIPANVVLKKYENLSPENIVKLYDATKIRPSFSQENTRDKLFEALLKIASSRDYYNKLEEILEMKSPREDVAAVYDELIGKGLLWELSAIEKITGIEVDEVKLLPIFQKALDDDFNRGFIKLESPQNYRDFHWCLKKCKAELPADYITSLYKRCISGSYIGKQKWKLIEELSDQPTPINLIKEEYQSVLSSDQDYDKIINKLIDLHRLSVDVRPEISEEQKKSLYRYVFTKRDSSTVEKLAEVIEKPDYTAKEAQELLQEIISKNPHEIDNAEKTLNTALVFTDEATEGIMLDIQNNLSMKIEEFLKNGSSNDSIIGYLKNIIAKIDLKLDEEFLQSQYARIMSKDWSWEYLLDELVNITGVMPKVPEALILERSKSVIQSANLQKIELFDKYFGPISYDHDATITSYKLIPNWRNCTEGDIAKLKRVQEISHVDFDQETSLGIIEYLTSNMSIYGFSQAAEALEYAKSEFGIQITDEIAQLAYQKKMPRDNMWYSYIFRTLAESKAIFGFPPKLSSDTIARCFQYLSEEGTLQHLDDLRELLETDELELPTEKVQAMYQEIFQSESFINLTNKNNSSGLWEADDRLNSIYKYTRIKPDLDQEQIDLGFLRSLIRNSGKVGVFKSIVEMRPTEATNERYLKFLLTRETIDENALKAFLENSRLEVTKDLFASILCTYLQQMEQADDLAKFEARAKQLQERFGLKPSLPYEVLESETIKLIKSSAASESTPVALINLWKWSPVGSMPKDIAEKMIDKTKFIMSQYLLVGRFDAVKQFETLFRMPIAIEPAEAQVLYAQGLWQQDSNHLNTFIRDRSGVFASEEAVAPALNSAFSLDFYDLDLIKMLCEILQPESVKRKLQEVYSSLLREYAKSHSNEDGYNFGIKYYNDYLGLLSATRIRPKFRREDAMELYVLCFQNSQEVGQKIAIIEAQTQYKIDDSFVEKYILENPDFNSEVSIPVTKDQLDKHFADNKNQSLAEYIRIYHIFSCFDYYQEVLGKLEKLNNSNSHNTKIAILTTMGVRDMGDDTKYPEIKDQLMQYFGDNKTPISITLAQSFAKLAEGGDAELQNLMSEQLKTYAKTSSRQNNENGPLGLTKIEETALRVLLNLDNQAATDTLLELFFVENLDNRVKVIILNNLIENKKSSFGGQDMKQWARLKLSEQKSSFDFQEIKYFVSVNKIPSADLRKKSLKHIDEAYDSFMESTSSLGTIQKEFCPDIPNYLMASTWSFSNHDRAVLKKINPIFQKCRGSADFMSLQYGITNLAECDENLLYIFTEKIKKIDILNDVSVSDFAETLKNLSFLDSVSRSRYDTGYNHDNSSNNADAISILNHEYASFHELSSALSGLSSEKIRQILPNDQITTEKVRAIWDHWGNLQPIFIYASKMAHSDPSVLNLVAEVVSHIDPTDIEDWKNWRYDLGTPVVREQIGHLSQDSFEIWKQDHFSELGEIMIAATPSDRPKQIRKHIENGLQNGHVYNEAHPEQETFKFINDKLQEFFRLSDTDEAQRKTVLRGIVAELRADMKEIDKMTASANLSKFEQAASTFAKDNKVKKETKIENMVGFIASNLPEELAENILLKFNAAETGDSGEIDTSDFIDDSARDAINMEIDKIKKNKDEFLASPTFEKYHFDSGQLKNMGQFYKKRQDLRIIQSLLQLSMVDIQDIATNRISAQPNKSGESLSKVMGDLKKYFEKNPAFVQDLSNIESVVTTKENYGEKRRLAMIISDEPQILFQVGKYPIGCGSCQNYEGDPSWNVSLAGYVADAHTKAAYLMDLNKLPAEIKAKIDSSSFNEVKDSIPASDILEASIARSIVKIVKNKDGAPVLFVEPTYSSVNKGDLTMNNYFNIFLELMVSSPMNIPLARGAGTEAISVPASRNPGGQYEDCGAADGGVGMGINIGSYTMHGRYIDKFTPATEADMLLAESIYSGGNNQLENDW